jgi:excinuclease ABC subunit C
MRRGFSILVEDKEGINRRSELPSEILKEKIKNLPLRPGVYLMHDAQGRVIYVGKAKILKKRVSSYFRHGGFASPRLRKLVASVFDLSFIRTESEAEALIVESRLIKRYQPFFNVDLKMGERYPWIKLTRERFPRIEITRHKADDGASYFGPFTRVFELRQLLRLVERHFPLRTCRSPEPTSPVPGRPCVRYALMRCLAPCVEDRTESRYGEIVADLSLLLCGNVTRLVERLRRRMEEAARGLRFEEAARLRDTIRAIWRYTRQKRNRVLPDDLDKDTWEAFLRLQSLLGLPSVPWRIDSFDISHFSGKETYGVVVVFEQGIPNPSLYRKFSIRDVEGIDDFRSIRETLRRRYSRSLKGDDPLPQLIVIDGGAQQLRFAESALRDLGLEGIPVVALAKQEEAVYTLFEEHPLTPQREDPALQLLQRLRDEAHRFAVSAHTRGRDNRNRRSILEEIPGVGKKRSAALLAKFGSIQRIAEANPEEVVSSLPGIGLELAQRIHEHLEGVTG